LLYDRRRTSELRCRSGRAEAVVDEDNYVELRYWHPADANPAQIVAVITQAMDTITAAEEKGQVE
jgi:hypothetical protein